MGKLAAVTCESAKPDKARDRLLGDGDGLFLRVRPHGRFSLTQARAIAGNWKDARRAAQRYPLRRA